MPYPVDLPDPEIERGSPAWQVDSSPTELSRGIQNGIVTLENDLAITQKFKLKSFCVIQQFHSRV